MLLLFRLESHAVIWNLTNEPKKRPNVPGIVCFYAEGLHDLSFIVVKCQLARKRQLHFMKQFKSVNQQMMLFLFAPVNFLLQKHLIRILDELRIIVIYLQEFSRILFQVCDTGQMGDKISA